MYGGQEKQKFCNLARKCQIKRPSMTGKKKREERKRGKGEGGKITKGRARNA